MYNIINGGSLGSMEFLTCILSFDIYSEKLKKDIKLVFNTDYRLMQVIF